MKPESVFSVVNGLALVAWLGLVLLPGQRWVVRGVGRIVPVMLAVLYAGIVGMRVGRVAGDFSSLAGVAALFRDPWVLLAGWIHYLAFDLLVGVWEVEDAATRGVSRWRLVPCLLLTFLFGPAGWLLYLAVRGVSGRSPGPGSSPS